MPVPPVHTPPYSDLPELIRTTFQSAREKDQISVFEAKSSSFHPSGTPPFLHQVFICPDLDEKPGAPHKTPDLSTQPEKDPFLGPSFEEGQSIADLGQHVCLTNSNAMRDEHFMIISKEFRPQAGELLERDLTTAYAIVQAYEKAGRDLLCFFNGGPAAGASQPHLHIQFIPFVDGKPPGAEQLAIAASEETSKGEPIFLDTEHVHYTLAFPMNSIVPTTSPNSSDNAKVLYSSYMALLSAFHKALDGIAEEEKPNTAQKRDSYNLLLTTKHMHLIPRQHDALTIPKPRTRAKKGVKEGEELDDEQMTLNGMSFAGIWFVGAEEDKQDVLEYGLEAILRHCGYKREVWLKNKTAVL